MARISDRLRGVRIGCAGLFLLAALLKGFGLNADGAEAPWEELKDKHFIVYYENHADRLTAQKILREAEHYYDRIGARIGFTRYGDFWTWERRANIFLFHDKASFTTRTGQPEWSTGYVNRDSYVSRTRAIVTYVQEREFFDGLLPHELSHLILHEYIRAEDMIPLWFDEGVAQYFEENKQAPSRDLMRALVSQGVYIPLRAMMALDISRDPDPERARIYYAQSLSLVDFLMTRFGRDSFARLCREMRDGKTFDQALGSAYPEIPGIDALEWQWLDHVRSR